MLPVASFARRPLARASREARGAFMVKYVYTRRSAVVQSLGSRPSFMTRTTAATLAFLLAVAPLGSAVAQDRDRGSRGGESRQADERPRVSVGQAVQRASSGREGRFLGASDRGDIIVVRWEYPGGRVADIMVDARTGRVVGER